MSRCALCPGVHTCVQPHGPQTRGGLLFIGEAPGVNEDKKGIPFIGRTGEEVDRHYLPLAGLRRQDMTFHNAISCLPPTPQGKLDPTKAAHIEMLHACAASNLWPLIDRMAPRLLVPMGHFACRAVFGEAFDLELRHGIPAESPWGMTFPMFHPALGLHEPKKMMYIRTDWDRLRKYLRGTLLVPTDPYAGQEDYCEITTPSDLEELQPDRPLACDTESSPVEGPFCLTYSQYPGTGRLIRTDNRHLVEAFTARLRDWHTDILFHNWLYDWTVVEEAGFQFPVRRVVDTMAVVYHIGNLPQGLKALVLRELGMVMHDFDDVVTPHSAKRALEYLELASFEDWPKPDPQMVLNDAGKWKVYKPQSMSTKLKRFFTDYRKHPDLDVFERWKNWEKSGDAATIEAAMGAFPQKDIRHVPFEQALFYACRDADALGRLWPLLKKMRSLVRRYSQERWRELAEAV